MGRHVRTAGRRLAVLAALALAAGVVPAAAHPDMPVDNPVADQLPHVDAQPHAETADEHSGSMRLVANWNDDGKYREGSDLAFWGDLAVLGNNGNPGGFRVLDIGDPANPALVGRFVCAGGQGDVSIWRDLVFTSVDTPMTAAECGSPPAPQAVWATGQAWEGIRIVSIADPAKPTQIATVDTDCGSHTHTLIPDTGHRDEGGRPAPRVLIYVSSYPLTTGVSPECNAAAHRQISVVEVPLDDPAQAKVIATPDVSPAIGCHDITVFLPGKLAGAACISESQLWDISDPVNPKILSHIRNAAMQIHHSAAFSWDGEVLVLGDEKGGAVAAAGCLSGGHAPTGSLWFFDVRDPSNPKLLDYYTIPQNQPSIFCTAHNFNVVPLRDGRRVLTTAWYNGGTHVLDFTDPANVTQIGWYKPFEGASWSSYWYNGLVYVNNYDVTLTPSTPRSRGLDVFAVDDPVLDKAVRLSHLNAQTQEPLPGSGPPAQRRGDGRRR